MTVPQEFQAVVLAAGKGSRMPELTAGKPKCLLPIGNKPMLWYPLYKLQQSGLTETIVIVCENHLADIQTTLDKTNLKIKIDYVTIANNDEMGTADSLRLLDEKIKSDLLIVSCDLITNVELTDVINLFRKHDASICSLMFNPGKSEPVVVPGPKAKHKPERDLIGIDSKTKRLVFLASASDFEGDVKISKALVKKHTSINVHSNLIDSHLYIMKNWVYKYLVHKTSKSTLKGEYIPHIIKKQLTKPDRKKEINATDNTNDVNDILLFIKENSLSKTIFEANSINDTNRGYHEDLIKCYAYVAGPEIFGVRVNTLPSYWSTNGKIMELWEKIVPNKELIMIDNKADVKSNQVDKTYVWDSCTLKEKTSFKNSIIGSNTEVNSFSRVFNSIVMNNVKIGERVILENCIVCDGAVIETKCTLKGCLVGTGHTVAEGEDRCNEVLAESDLYMEL